MATALQLQKGFIIRMYDREYKVSSVQALLQDGSVVKREDAIGRIKVDQVQMLLVYCDDEEASEYWMFSLKPEDTVQVVKSTLPTVMPDGRIIPPNTRIDYDYSQSVPCR